jgi:hypothetical protein
MDLKKLHNRSTLKEKLGTMEPGEIEFGKME